MDKESQFSLDRGAYGPGTYIIDSDGRKYRVLGVTRLRKSRSVLDLLSPHPWWLIDVHLDDAVLVSLDDAKHDIESLVCDRRWHRQGDQSADQFRKYLADARTFKELIDKISFYGSW
jgi:hypothetical protein